jgi:hypothetical protein
MSAPAADGGGIGAHRIADIAFDALRRDRRGGIDAHPAAPVDPDFIPGVRIALAQDPIIREAIERAALVAGDDARGYSGGAHQDGKRRGIVAAKSALGVE